MKVPPDMCSKGGPGASKATKSSPPSPPQELVTASPDSAGLPSPAPQGQGGTQLARSANLPPTAPYP